MVGVVCTLCVQVFVPMDVLMEARRSHWLSFPMIIHHICFETGFVCHWTWYSRFQSGLQDLPFSVPITGFTGMCGYVWLMSGYRRVKLMSSYPLIFFSLSWSLLKNSTFVSIDWHPPISWIFLSPGSDCYYSVFCSMILTFLDSVYKWDYTVLIFLHLDYFTYHYIL